MRQVVRQASEPPPWVVPPENLSEHPEGAFNYSLSRYIIGSDILIGLPGRYWITQKEYQYLSPSSQLIAPTGRLNIFESHVGK
jgi:hypothetical protein